MEISDEAYKKLVLEVAAARGMAPKAQQHRFSLSGCLVWLLSGIMFVVFLIALVPNIIASYNVPVPAPLRQYLATPQTVLQTRQETPGAQGHVSVPPALPSGGGDGAPAWPTLTPQPQETEAPTLTIPPAPTAAPSFWTEEELAQMTATAEAFYTVIPTAEPAFVEYAAKACQDPEQVAESATLRLFCGK